MAIRRERFEKGMLADTRPPSSGGNGESRVRDPLRTLRGKDIALVVKELVEAGKEARPDEASDAEPIGIQALYGRNYGSLSHRVSDVEDDRRGILGSNRSDNSLEFILHDTTLAILLGKGIEPVVRARRGKVVMAEALDQLARYRWETGKQWRTARKVAAEARTRGTAASIVFRNRGSGLARSTWIPTRQLILDPHCDGDVDRTRFRAWERPLPRSEVRRLWGDDAADAAGGTTDRDRSKMSYSRKMLWEMEPVDVCDFYYAEVGLRRHVVIIDGWPDPVQDHDYWPYDLPDDLWPIPVFLWNAIPGRVWGATDLKLSQLWHEATTWTQRFLLDGSAIASKVLAAFDKSVTSHPGELRRALEDLRTPLSVVEFKMREMGMAGFSIERLLKLITVPVPVERLTTILELSRSIVASVSALDEMQLRLQDPLAEPPRLVHRLARWVEYLAECLALESFVDISTLPSRALVVLARTTEAGDPIVTKAYMGLAEAESLERNQTPSAINRGLTADQFSEGAAKERLLRQNAKAWDGQNARPVSDDELVRIENPGIARYVTHQSLVDSWEGMSMPASRVLSEFRFDVRILGSKAASEQAGQAAGAAMGQIVELYARWGSEAEVIDYQQRYDKARRDGVPVPPPPRMLANVIAVHRALVRATATDLGENLDLRPEDIAYAMLKGKELLDQQAAAQAAAAAPAVDPMAMQIEQQKLALGQQKIEADRMKNEFNLLIQQMRLEVERKQAETEGMRQLAERAKYETQMAIAQMKFQMEQAMAPYDVHQRETRARSAEAKAAKDEVAGQVAVVEAQNRQQDADIERVEREARAARDMASASLAQVQADKIVSESEARQAVPPDTKEALNIAAAQQALATAAKEKAQADAIEKEAKNPKKEKD